MKTTFRHGHTQFGGTRRQKVAESRTTNSTATIRMSLLCVVLLPFITALSISTPPKSSVSMISSSPSTIYKPNGAPEISPATGLENKFYSWREGQQIRYQCTGKRGGEPVLLIHGLFVNSDHWRKTLEFLGHHGYDAYAIDLFGCGYSDKPPADSHRAQACNGEKRFLTANPTDATPTSGILKSFPLGSSDGKTVRVRDIELRHPLGSPYNFYTWSELIRDFCQDVILKNDTIHKDVTLVANSIGTISAMQAILDAPELYKGAFLISPNFRELHSAEVPFPSRTMPILRAVQKQLRTRGQRLFNALAKPNTVKEILKTPYVVESAVDDTLVKVLLDPLLTEGASNVVFDTLSYSAGPLPEQQLTMFPENKPVWVCYGKDDEWTPSPRVEALSRLPPVQKVVGWQGVGHCPHDEAPEKVNPLLLEFLKHVGAKEQ